MGRWIWRLTKCTVLLLLVLAGVSLIAGRALLVASLPRESGSAGLAALQGEVEVSRDNRGVPLIRASSGDYADAAAALGFVHAQERFFQMDLMRRRAAGELAELFGSFALPSDREMRRYRMRSVAKEVLPRLPDQHQRWIGSYSAGVNAGLADMSVRPPEYLALAQSPREWLPEDSILAALAMHHGLSMGARFELQYDVLRALGPAGVAEFLMPETARSDSPVIGAPGDPLGPVPIPGPNAVEPWPVPDVGPPKEATTPPLGSNNFAVAGSLTGDGRAILANDMHLQIGVPNTWFHAQLEWGEHRVVGVTLPGVPGIAVGSNGKVAWGFTNTTGDFEDWVLVEVDSKDPTRYRFGPGEADLEPFGEIIEDINIRGGTSEHLTLRTTRWGPVIQRDSLERPLVLKWPALDPATVNLRILDMVEADSLEAAVECARSWWGPPQNVVIASADGRIAWTVSGWIPKRKGIDGRLPASWAASGVGWEGPIDEKDRPVLMEPRNGRLATANARTLPLEKSRILGWCWAAGDRAARIMERLNERDAFTESELLSVQLDTRATGFDYYRDLVLESVSTNDPDPMVAIARRSVAEWNGHADANSVGFRVLERFHRMLEARLLSPLWEQRKKTDPAFAYRCFQDEEPLRRILEERPAHFLPKGAAEWPIFFRDTFRASLRRPGSEENYDAGFTWGDANRSNLQHPFSLAVPLLGRVLNMPQTPLPGHSTTARVQGRSFGASQRLVVSPGHEGDAILHLPCGQSGHPLSRHYDDGHAAWANGEARPLLSGEVSTTFRLVPK